jgi:serine/threonine protein kinase
LRDGQLVAIKRQTKGTADEIIGDFLSELGIMANVNHPNTAKLIGYGTEGGMHLVLELSPHGSLASVLYGQLSIWGYYFSKLCCFINFLPCWKMPMYCIYRFKGKAGLGY